MNPGFPDPTPLTAARRAQQVPPVKVPGFELTDSQQAEKKVIDAQHEAWRALKVRQVIAMRANGQQPYVKPDPVTIAKRRHLGKLAKQARKAARAA